jgi:hypothetical protein
MLCTVNLMLLGSLISGAIGGTQVGFKSACPDSVFIGPTPVSHDKLK